VENNYELWRDYYESQWEEKHTFLSNQNEKVSKVEGFTCHEFFRLFFYPRDIGARNSMSNSLEVGDNDDVILIQSLFTRRMVEVNE
jgi:hypothetical protein